MTRAIDGSDTDCEPRWFELTAGGLSISMFEEKPGSWAVGLDVDGTIYSWLGPPAPGQLVITPTSSTLDLVLAGPDGTSVRVAGELTCPTWPTTPAPEDVRARLAHHAGADARPYATFDFGRERYPAAASAIIPQDGAEAVLARLRADLPPGWVAYLGTTRFLDDAPPPPGSAELVVAPGTGFPDVLRSARTDAVNYDLGTEALIEALAAWDRAWGIDVVHAETDTIDLALARPPADPRAFAREVYELCPDVVDQGVGSVEALADDIARSSRVSLWWD